jgi:putative tryptophan/tyrosine transport system substrate-binding protein
MSDMRRREFITLMGGAAAAWPLAGAADARPRLAFLTLGPQQNVHLAFVDGLRRLGYAQGPTSISTIATAMSKSSSRWRRN